MTDLVTLAHGIDAYGAISAPLLKNYDFVGRYVSQQVGKCIVASEVAGYHAAGKSLVLVYEDNATDALGGAGMGLKKAAIARPILNAIKWPADLPVHFAVDMPGYAADLATFVACAKAFAAGIGRPAAIYGDVDTCTAAHNAGIRYLWQFGQGQAPGVTITQGPSIQVDGYDVDPDTALVADYGQWSPNLPKPIQEDDMDILIVTNPNNGGEAILYLVDGTYEGEPNPDMLNFYKANGVKTAIRQPTKAEWALFKQKGSI